MTMAASLLWAQPKHEGQGGGFPHMIAPFGHGGQFRNMENAPPMILDVEELRTLLGEIGIDSGTTVKIVDLSREFMKKFDGLIIKVQRQELAIREELLKEKPDLKVVQKCIGEKSQYFSQIEFLQIKRDLDIKALLTPDQYDKLKTATVKKMRAMMPAAIQHDGAHCNAHEKEPVHRK